jgi:hypothetical protein
MGRSKQNLHKSSGRTGSTGAGQRKLSESTPDDDPVYIASSSKDPLWLLQPDGSVLQLNVGDKTLSAENSPQHTQSLQLGQGQGLGQSFDLNFGHGHAYASSLHDNTVRPEPALSHHQPGGGGDSQDSREGGRSRKRDARHSRRCYSSSAFSGSSSPWRKKSRRHKS